MPRLLAGLGLSYLILRPVSSNQVLVPVLAGMGLLAALAWLVHRRPLAAELRPIWFVQLVFGCTGLLVGAINGNPGWSSGGLVWIAAPILFWVMTAAVDARTLKFLLTTTALATGVLSTGIVLYVLAQEGLAPEVIPTALLDASGAGFDGTGDAPAIRLYGLSTLAAVGPLFIASLFVRSPRLMPPLSLRLWATVSAMSATLVSGRRAVLVVILLTPIILWVCRWLLISGRPRATPPRRPLGQRIRSFALPVTAVSLTAAIVGSMTDAAFEAIYGAVRSVAIALVGRAATPPSGDVRDEQADRLVQTWADQPVAGNGFGAVIPGYARSLERPWNFELQYHLILFQTGLLGLLFFIVVGILVIRAVRCAAEADPTLLGTLVATSSGAIAMLIANASNPYLQAPGHMWIIYLPLAVANIALATQRTEGQWGSRYRIVPDFPLQSSNVTSADHESRSSDTQSPA